MLMYIQDSQRTAPSLDHNAICQELKAKILEEDTDNLVGRIES